MAVQVNGKVRGRIEVARDASEDGRARGGARGRDGARRTSTASRFAGTSSCRAGWSVSSSDR